MQFVHFAFSITVSIFRDPGWCVGLIERAKCFHVTTEITNLLVVIGRVDNCAVYRY